jgi:pyrroloquinoline quinone biosynthesis protein E
VRVSAERPYTLIAELSYRCPLHCVYCSNPIDFAAQTGELDTDAWRRVFAEAETLGVVQLHLTGGEPLARRDLEELVAAGRRANLYVNLITSGVPLERARLRSLAQAGVDHVQLSVQDADAARADAIAGGDYFDAKMRVAEWVKAESLPLTVNVVLHRHNLDHIEEVIALGERLGADRLELANTQYHGFALQNRGALIPSRAQLDRARAVAAEARARLAGRMELIFVLPDYYSEFPKACMDGWARRFVHVVPDGTVLPCHSARMITGLQWLNVRDHSLEKIWNESEAFQAFRGEAWMPEPCRGCERRAIDFGGCRCQAFALTGRAAATDPACSLAPDHVLVENARAAAADATPPRYLYRGARDRS